MELSLQQLKQLLPKNPYVDHWHEALEQLLPDYDINTPQRIAAFIAQCAHESGGFVALKENLTTRLLLLEKYFPSTFPMMLLLPSLLASKKQLPIKCMLVVWAMDQRHLEMDSDIVAVV